MRRSSQEMICVSIILALGYRIQFRKPRLSKKTKPFLLIDKIYKEKEIIFDLHSIELDYLKEKKDKKKSNNVNCINIKEILTSIVMENLIILLEQNPKIQMKTKFRYEKQKNPKFLWIEQLSIDNILYLKETIFKIGILMLDIVDDVKNRHDFDLEYDYNKFIQICNKNNNERFFDFIKLLEMLRQQIPQERII